MVPAGLSEKRERRMIRCKRGSWTRSFLSATTERPASGILTERSTFSGETTVPEIIVPSPRRQIEPAATGRE